MGSDHFPVIIELQRQVKTISRPRKEHTAKNTQKTSLPTDVRNEERTFRLNVIKVADRIPEQLLGPDDMLSRATFRQESYHQSR